MSVQQKVKKERLREIEAVTKRLHGHKRDREMVRQKYVRTAGYSLSQSVFGTGVNLC